MKAVSATLAVRLLVGFGGIAAIGYGLFLARTTLRRWPDVIATALWFGLPPVIFDLVLVPVIGLLGAFVARKAKRTWRAPLILGLIVSGALLVIAAPFVAGIGRRVDNPSLLDRPYLLGTAIALAVIWAVVVGWGLIRKER